MLVLRDSAWVRWLVRAAVAVFLIGTAYWAMDAGLRLRQQTWAYTRSIRYHGDIANGMRWGDRVLRAAEKLANAGGTTPGVQASASPTPGRRDQRPLTFMEIVRGEGQVYQNLVNEQPDGNFELDYPPLRLLTMALWTRHAQSVAPGLSGWPNAWRLKYDPAGNPAELATEDIAGPVLMMNTWAAGGASVVGFFLVWLWVDRGGRATVRATAGTCSSDSRLRQTARWLWRCVAPHRQLEPRRRTPLRHSSALLLFPVTGLLFFYALSVAESPVPAPPPALAFAGPPTVYRVGKKMNATVPATVNPQGAAAQCYVQWGLRAGAYCL